MSDIERIEQRLSALERAVVDGDSEVPALEDRASLAADLETAVERLEAHDRRLADLEGRVDAVEGAVGGVESVDDAVERQANAAVAAVDRLEFRIDGLERALEGHHDRNGSRSGSEPGDEGTAERAAPKSTADARDERESGSPPIASTDAVGESGERPGVERTVEAIVSTADDDGRSSDDPLSEGEVDGAAAADGAAATDEADGTTGILGSLRDRLP
ncbi:DUF7310 family coiled-coil domain-containing protein [Natrinema sp. CGMCC1.2065]|uniref:DUF7310 family coiled-coil domain-containing protein n=1 Tax=Natrinema sp. CGMCC1.2065 TaxID=3445767 RepID=UPI003F49D730